MPSGTPTPVQPELPFPYRISRSQRKTVAIYVKSGEVDVRAPLTTSKKWIDDFVRQKARWVLGQLEQQRRRDSEKLRIADNRSFTYFGEARTILVIISQQQKVEMSGDFLFIYTRRNQRQQLENLFNRWLLNQAREYMTTQTIKVARKLGVEHKLKDVVFRKTKTKWGHCCHDGTIQYNWLVMMAPKPVVDYLIAHETSHLRHMNHSEKFWQTVASVCPDYPQKREWLKTNGHRLWPEA